MKKWIVSYKLQNFLAMIPLIGFLTVWLVAWFNIYKVTKNKAYVFLHYVIWLMPIIIVGLVVCLLYFYFIIRIDNSTMKIILTIIVSYFACLGFAFSALGIEKGIIEKFEKAKLKKAENNL